MGASGFFFWSDFISSWIRPCSSSSVYLFCWIRFRRHFIFSLWEVWEHSVCAQTYVSVSVWSAGNTFNSKSLTKRTTAPYITSPRQTSTLTNINTTPLHNKTEDSHQNHIMQSKNLLSTLLYLKVQQNKANFGLFMASKDLEYSTEATWITFLGAFYNLKALFSIYWKGLCVLYDFMKESTRVRNDIHFWVNKMYGFSNIKFKVMNWDNITDFFQWPI